MSFFKIKIFNKQLLFLFFSFIAVLIDCSVFQMLLFLNIGPFFANCISSIVAVSINYYCVINSIFTQLNGAVNFLLFLTWYMTSIFIFSKSIEYLISWTNLPSLFCKIGILPLSFVVNYYFILFLSKVVLNDKSNTDSYSNIQL